LISKKSWRGLLLEPVENTLLQLPRALVASALAALLDMVVLIVLVQAFGWHPLFAVTLSYLLGGVLQYVLSALWVFPSAPQSVTLGFLAFTLLSLGGLVITWLTMYCLGDLAHVNYAVAKVAALGLAFCWNFFSRKHLLFRPEEKCDAAEA
jgi:putative flippase GtrA